MATSPATQLIGKFAVGAAPVVWTPGGGEGDDGVHLPRATGSIQGDVDHIVISAARFAMTAALGPAELDRLFEQRQQAVMDYGASWWLDDEQAQVAMVRHSRLRSVLARLALVAGTEEEVPVTTEDVFADLDTAWEADRCALHEDILTRSFLEVNEPSGTTPVVAFCLGLPGSGKSTHLIPLAHRYMENATGSHAALVRDADMIRVEIPQYRDGLGSLVTQPECAYLTYKRAAPVLERIRCNVIVDCVGNREHLLQEIDLFRARGSRVHLMH